MPDIIITSYQLSTKVFISLTLNGGIGMAAIPITYNSNIQAKLFKHRIPILIWQNFILLFRFVNCMFSYWICYNLNKSQTRRVDSFFYVDPPKKEIIFDHHRLSRSRQLGGLVLVVRLGVPLRCKACKLCDPLN